MRGKRQGRGKGKETAMLLRKNKREDNHLAQLRVSGVCPQNVAIPV